MYKVLEMIWNGFCLLFVMSIIVGAIWAMSSGALDCKPSPGPVCTTTAHK